jgi:hypothetical protein
MRFPIALACLLALAGCTIPFTPGDAKPGSFTPFPSGAASGSMPAEGQGMRGGPGTPP